MDEWSSTPPSAQEFPKSPTDGVRALLDVIERQKRELDEFRNGLLSQSGLRVTPEGLLSTDFDGNVATGDPGTTGWALSPSRALLGELILRPGSVGNDTLANPVLIQSTQGGVDNYAIGAAVVVVRKTITFTVPAGFTKAYVLAIATAMGYNNTASDDALYVQAIVQGVQGGELFTWAPSGASVGVSNPFFENLVGLTGGDVISVAVSTRTAFGTWSASVTNRANIYASATFTR